MKENLVIHIIDDEPFVCKALSMLFETLHYKVEVYQTAHSFLENINSRKQGCIIMDVRMPDMSGLELLEHLKLQKFNLPTIVMTAYGDITTAVRAMKLGAKDFILKPLNEQCLLDTVQRCITQSEGIYAIKEIHQCVEALSKREHQILLLIVEGRLNKQISSDLSISISTVEAHRVNIMNKMKAKNVAHLVKLYLQQNLC